jgi:hypothetical protein
MAQTEGAARVGAHGQADPVPALGKVGGKVILGSAIAALGGLLFGYDTG